MQSSFKTPMEINLKFKKSKEISSDLKYRNLIGELLCISSDTRPDISYSVNYLSQFQNYYHEMHFKYALRILKYLYFTRDLNLMYERNKSVNILDCFVDSVWAGDITVKKSTIGYVIRLFGNVIYWKAKKHYCKIVYLS